ncbi:MAG: hypothetical protein IJY92_05750 [Alphaproteobacteria bacterium]|nr:hypothetical protein [Alphaproteobacteria bacterium]
MKKIILTIVSSVFILLTTACSDEVLTSSKQNVLIFSRSQCVRTPKAIEFLKELQQKDSNIRYELKDLSVGENRIMLKKLAHQYELSKMSVPTPIIFTPKGYILGWDEKTGETLKRQLNIR